MAAKKIDVICAGEILADLIGGTKKMEYQLFAGGSPANLANNLAYLGNKVALIGTIGKDEIGDFLLKNIKKSGLNSTFIKKCSQPTSLILVNKTKGTPNFEAYRSADREITRAQIDRTALKKAKLFHTSCFALSREPARSTIMESTEIALDAGVQISIDLNYAEKIWKKPKKAKKLVEEYISKGALLKISDVDYRRLYKSEIEHPEKILDKFLSMGAKQVCLTLGDKGVWAADTENETFLPSRKIKIVDTTGAGDAFWSGYLTAWLAGKSIVDCAKSGRAVAEYKLGRMGSIDKKIDIKKLLK